MIQVREQVPINGVKCFVLQFLPAEEHRSTLHRLCEALDWAASASVPALQGADTNLKTIIVKLEGSAGAVVFFLKPTKACVPIIT